MVDFTVREDRAAEEVEERERQRDENEKRRRRRRKAVQKMRMRRTKERKNGGWRRSGEVFSILLVLH